MRFKFLIILVLTMLINQAFCQPAEKPAFEKAAESNLPAGSTAPDFSLVDSNGKLIHLKDYKGKVVILDVWATWCVPCRAELPILDSLSQFYKDKGVLMLAVCSADSKSDFTTYIQNNKAKFKCTFLFDEQGKSLREGSFRSVYGINGFPTTMVIDKSGIIRGYGFNADEIKLLIESAL